MSLVVRLETTKDQAAVRHVHQAAFGGDAEANLVDALRDGGFAEVSLVAEVDGEIVGHILFSRLSIVTKVGTVDALSLAPMAVLPSHQRQGIGSKLVEAGLEACRDAGHRIVVEYAIENDWTTENPVLRTHRPTYDPRERYLKPEEVGAFLKGVDSLKSNIAESRDRVLFAAPMECVPEIFVSILSTCERSTPAIRMECRTGLT
jgi:GNAT superfamily N-acetyltransferase